jgi:hypothetical protein
MRLWTLLAMISLGCPAFADDAATRNAYVPSDDPMGETAERVVYLDQGWSAADSLRFYFTSQGSQIIPYDWFLALEQPDSSTPFRDARNMLRFRYLPQLPSAQNPDGLPVGFAVDQGSDRRWIGFTCAACHTSEIHYGKTAYRIDGAPTMGDVRALLSSLIEAMQKTLADASKFDRFAVRVLGTLDSPTAREYLKLQLEKSIEVRVAYNVRNFPHYDPTKPAPPPDSFGRLDAFGAIMNEVYEFARKPGTPTGDPALVRVADAPTSYPFLWDTPSQNLVQWIGIANGGTLDILSLARNVGEVLGVFGILEIPPQPTVLGYRSTVRVDSLRKIEDWLKTLRSPRWPADFPAIDQEAANKGREIYKNKCLNCHALIGQGGAAVLSDTKTDRRTWDNFFLRSGPSGKLEGAFANVVDVTERTRIGPTADAATMLRNAVAGTIVGVWKEPPPDVLSQVRFKAAPPRIVPEVAAPPAARYKARPLDGIWATAPYLHNGSVPNLDELLQPASKRSKSFSIGVRTFDPEHVGFVTDSPGFPKLDTTALGNSNAGHEGTEYGTDMSDQERRQLLEYLKTL